MNLNIVDLISTSDVTKLYNDQYKTRLVNKITKHFNKDEQQLFIASFYSYLNHDSKTEFIINLSDIWKWLGFSRIDHAKTVLKKHFVKETDYIFAPEVAEVKKENLGNDFPQVVEKKETRGGYNKETILMTINTFKKLCLKSNTKRADTIHDYFIKLEEILNETMKEEAEELSKELNKKIEEHQRNLIEHKEQSEIEKQELLERTILEQFPRNTQCVYYGTIDNTSLIDEDLIKFGQSNDLPERIKCHKKTFTNFRLVKAFKVNNQIQIENAIKKHDLLKNKRRNISINDKLYTECLALNNKFTIDKIDNYIKEIIDELEYNIENYNKLLEKNEELNTAIYTLKDQNELLKKDNEMLKKKVEEFAPTTTIKKKEIGDSSNGSLLYAYECKTVNNVKRYKCEMIKENGLEARVEMYKKMFPKEGKLAFTKKIKTTGIHKIIQYMLRTHLIFVGDNTYSGDLDAIKLIFNIVAKIEQKFILNECLQNSLDLLEDTPIQQQQEIEIDPYQPQVRKGKREIEQIDKNTGQVIATYESLNSAGRALNCTGNTIGIALRNNTLAKGFVWKYVGVTLDQQLTAQKVVKVCCEDGTRQKFTSYVAAGKDVNVSSVTIRNRIMTNVHTRINGRNYHWIIDTDN